MKSNRYRVNSKAWYIFCYGKALFLGFLDITFSLVRKQGEDSETLHLVYSENTTRIPRSRGLWRTLKWPICKERGWQHWLPLFNPVDFQRQIRFNGLWLYCPFSKIKCGLHWVSCCKLETSVMKEMDYCLKCFVKYVYLLETLEPPNLMWDFRATNTYQRQPCMTSHMHLNLMLFFTYKCVHCYIFAISFKVFRHPG